MQKSEGKEKVIDKRSRMIKEAHRITEQIARAKRKYLV